MDSQPESGSLVLDQTVMTPRPVRVVCIGAGFAGLMLAHRIKYDEKYKFIDFQVYEKNGGIGGTWYENRYPGAACDVSLRYLQSATSGSSSIKTTLTPSWNLGAFSYLYIPVRS